jgi:hypothetical protein
MPASVDELVKLADDLMYVVKVAGRNAIRVASYPAAVDDASSTAARTE